VTRRNAPRPSFIIWASAGGVVALNIAVYASIQAAERHSTALWTACLILIASALLTFAGTTLEWRRRDRGRALDGRPPQIGDRDDG